MQTTNLEMDTFVCIPKHLDASEQSKNIAFYPTGTKALLTVEVERLLPDVCIALTAWVVIGFVSSSTCTTLQQKEEQWKLERVLNSSYQKRYQKKLRT